MAVTHDFPSSILDANKLKSECLRSLLAMEYNGEGHWYDVDPLVLRLPRFSEAVQAFKEARAGGVPGAEGP